MKQKLFYPVNLDLQGKRCLLVGGGPVAAHKARSLLQYGAAVTVVSPEVSAKMSALVKAKKVAWIRKKYSKADLKGIYLVIAATNVAAVNALVSRHAGERQMLVNVVDVPELCNFIVPSVFRRGPIIVGISTGGQSPMVAQKIRKMIAEQVGPGYAVFTRMLGTTRQEVKRRGLTMPQRRAFYRRVIDSPILELLENGRTAEADRLLKDFMKTDLPGISKGFCS